MCAGGVGGSPSVIGVGGSLFWDRVYVLCFWRDRSLYPRKFCIVFINVVATADLIGPASLGGLCHVWV